MIIKKKYVIKYKISIHRNTICEIKHSLGGINNRLDPRDKKIGKLVDTPIEIAQTEAHREKRVKKNNKESLCEPIGGCQVV